MEKIKQFVESEKGKDILIVIIVILVGLGSFELGRLSKGDDSQGQNINNGSQNNNDTSQISVDNPTDVGRLDTTGDVVRQANPGRPTSSFFASSKGKKYYTANCSAGKNIKQANLVYFNTAAQAEAAGYTLSTSCN
jgi:hypothetical protein